jgi:hypothetical protein
MTEIIKKIFGYWEVWHMVLATWLYLIFFFHIWDGHKQLSFLCVLAVALLWEIVEFFWEQSKGFESYNGNRKAFFVNSFKDLLAALVSCVVCTGLL